MQFYLIKDAIKNTLGEQSKGRFQVIGFQRQSKSADEFQNNNKMVQVYFSEGAFPKGSSGIKSHKQHDITINIDLTASAAAKGALSILNSETSSENQKAVAIASIKEASEVADNLIDELIHIVFNIIEDARNVDFGLPEGIISNRWITSIKKDTSLDAGDLVVKTANMIFTCRCEETVIGDEGNTPDTVIFDSSLKADDTEGAGVSVENDNTED